MGDMNGKVAVVTGGTQGLGAAVARLFARRGAEGLVLCGRSERKGRAVAEEIEREWGTRVSFVAADLAEVDACRRVVGACDERWGRVDALVNVAAITDRGTILDTSAALFDRMIAVNLRAPFFLMQEAVRVMRREGTRGTIVNVASMSSRAGQGFLAAYSTSKGGLATLTRNTGYALLPDRIRVNGLNIGWMATEGEDRIQRDYHDAADGWQERAAATLPFGRLVDPEEVARAVAFLASDESGLMTGAMVNYDQSVWGGYDAAPVPAAPI